MEMSCDNLLPIREWEIDDGMDHLDSSVAQEDIDRTEFFDDASKCRLDRFFAGNIHLHRERRFFSRLNFVSNCFRSLQIDIGDRNPRTFSGKCFRNRLSDSGRRSRHNS